MKKYLVDWAKVNWTHPNRQLSRELRVPETAVSHYRRKNAPLTIRRKKSKE